MPRPRLSLDQKLVPVKVTLSPARFDELSKVAARQGKPLAHIVREFVEPAFREPETKRAL